MSMAAKERNVVVTGGTRCGAQRARLGIPPPASLSSRERERFLPPPPPALAAPPAPCSPRRTYSGIGLVLVQRLIASHPTARLLLIARSRSKAEAAISSVHAQAPKADIAYVLADMSRPAEVVRAAAEIRARCVSVLSRNGSTRRRGHRQSKAMRVVPSA